MNATLTPFVMASAKGAVWLLVWSWQAAVLLACVWAGLKIVRVKSPALRHQVWLFAVVAVVVMPAMGAVVETLPLPRPSNVALSYAAEFPRIVITNDTSPSVQTPAPARPARPSAKRPLLLSLSFALWSAGVCVFAARAVGEAVRLQRLREKARVVAPADLGYEGRDCEALRKGGTRLALTDEIRSPALIGVFRPMILFPADVKAWASPEERLAMLRHELAHVARRDHHVNLFQTVFGVVFFFHPLARHACRQLTVEREMACDDRVVASGADAESYAESLVKVAERSVMQIGTPVGAPGGVNQLALFSARQLLERRIEMILNKDRVRVLARQWKYLILPLALIAVVAWVLLPARLTKPGLAQRVTGEPPKDIGESLAVYMEDGKNFDDLVELALTSPAPETRKKAVWRLIVMEGPGSTSAMVKLYERSDDLDLKALVIDSLAWRGAIDPLMKIASSDSSPEFRRQALYRIKWLKETSENPEVKSQDITALQDQLNGLSDEPPAPPPPPLPPPPPPAPSEMIVDADKALTPLRWHDGNSVFSLLREVARARMRHDTSFLERALDEEYVETGPNGETLNKQQAIAAAGASIQGHRARKFEFDNLSVSGNEQIAFATFLGTVYFESNGQESVEQYRYTVNFVERDGQFKIAALQMTRKE
jgi:beta-lactamase regulating signal transducer with metallopeptidase domain